MNRAKRPRMCSNYHVLKDWEEDFARLKRSKSGTEHGDP
jgi:hypothetical protein